MLGKIVPQLILIIPGRNLQQRVEHLITYSSGIAGRYSQNVSSCDFVIVSAIK